MEVDRRTWLFSSNTRRTASWSRILLTHSLRSVVLSTYRL